MAQKPTASGTPEKTEAMAAAGAITPEPIEPENRDEVADFNRGRSDGGVVLKLGLHLGSCIAVTAGGVLDYFGSTVNTASRLEHQCRGGE